MKTKRLFYFAGNQPDPNKVTPDEMEEWYLKTENRIFKNWLKSKKDREVFFDSVNDETKTPDLNLVEAAKKYKDEETH